LWREAGDIVNSIVVNGNKEADQAEREGIIMYEIVFANQGNGKNNYQWVEADSLVPAQYTRSISHDIAKIETGKHANQG